ncbi:hypothetical protein FOL47_005859 [Perkinsus chesapeaki]|uniref:Uncharacterized protein n=1 Tax=Perkinsus chesapeaki TaxID=330153 RepID=A0A7J6LV63_PERCH|nr:hypothetical protein FOL47_005859 [Perkinsus chesapeaki]
MVASVPFVSPVPLKSRGHSAALSQNRVEHGPRAPWDDGRPKVNPNGIYPRSGSENDWLKKAGYSQRKHHTKQRASLGQQQHDDDEAQTSPKMRTPSKNSPMRVKDTMQLEGELPKDEIYANPQRRHFKQPKTGRPSMSREFKRQIFPSEGVSTTLLDDEPILPPSIISIRYTNKSRSSPPAPWR